MYGEFPLTDPLLERILRPAIALAYVVMLLAGLGFTLALCGLLLSLAGLQLLHGALDEPLLVGIFVVWFPTVLFGSVMVSGAKNSDFWKIVLSGCPAWMRRTFYVLVAFGMVNFSDT